MTKIDLGQTISILANVGVIAGIVFLAVEIDQSNRLARMQMRNDIADSISMAAGVMASNAKLDKLYIQGSQGPNRLVQMSGSDSIRSGFPCGDFARICIFNIAMACSMKRNSKQNESHGGRRLTILIFVITIAGIVSATPRPKSKKLTL